MQQANTAEAPSGNPAPAARPPAAAGRNAFVINLTSSTTPVALTRPDHAGLNRFTFFLSRRLEDGRERFRLHMGYFDTQEEAEKLLDIVRTIYPGAWAGAAPGRRLGLPAPPAPSRAPPAPPAAPAPPAPPAPPARPAPPAPSRALSSPAAQAPVPASAVPGQGTAALTHASKRPTALTAAAPVIPASATGEKARESDDIDEQERRAAALSLSRVREAIASLGDGTREMPAVIPTVMPPRAASTQRTPQPIAPVAAAQVLSDSGVLRVLENGAVAVVAAGSATIDPGSGAGAAAPSHAPSPGADRPYYAVQLVWSVRPIALSQVPQLAIFSAYTLYGAEGNRDGRRWYGLRLGFFTDAVSAKQVAHYVRGDFATVSVVPVTLRERAQALTAAAARAGAVPEAAAAIGNPPALQAAAAASKAATATEFAFIDDEPLQIRDAQPTGRAKPAAAAAKPSGRDPTQLPRAARPAPGKRAKLRSGSQVQARTRVKPKTLEQTLEILGANLLQVEEEPTTSINDSGVRHLRLEPVKGKASKLSRLFERLAERTGS